MLSPAEITSFRDHGLPTQDVRARAPGCGPEEQRQAARREREREPCRCGRGGAPRGGRARAADRHAPRRSKAFYGWLLGEDALHTDFTHLWGDPSVRDDPDRVYGGCSFTVGRQVLGLRPVAPAGDRFDPDRVGLDHLALTVGSRAELEAAAERLAAAGVEHGEVIDLPDFRVTILSVQDPDGITLELSAPLQP